MGRLNKKHVRKASVTLVVATLLIMNCILAFQSYTLKHTLSITQKTNIKLKSKVSELNKTVNLLEEENNKLCSTIDKYALKYRTLKLKYKDNGFKSWEDYKNITCKSSPQYKLIHSSAIHVSSDGLLRDKYGYVGVALGSYFGDIGDRLILTTSKGKSIKVIIIDQKATKDTTGNSVQKVDGSMVEFVICEAKAKNYYSDAMYVTGNFSDVDAYAGKITHATKVKFLS